MADPLMRFAALLCTLGAISPGAFAQAAMADPTRPPAAFDAPAPDAVNAGGPVLQSVIIPGKGLPLAIIDGQQVCLGQRFGESRLVKLSEREAVLDGPSGLTRLLLTPDVEKTAASKKSVAKETIRMPVRPRAPAEGKP